MLIFFFLCALAFLSAALAGMGVGSAGLLVVYLTWIGHRPQLEAQQLNLIFFIASSLVALLIHLLQKRLDFRVILLCTLPACLGAVGGAAIARASREVPLSRAFGILMILGGGAALVVWLCQKPKKKEASSPEGFPRKGRVGTHTSVRTSVRTSMCTSVRTGACESECENARKNERESACESECKNASERECKNASKSGHENTRENERESACEIECNSEHENACENEHESACENACKNADERECKIERESK